MTLAIRKAPTLILEINILSISLRNSEYPFSLSSPSTSAYDLSGGVTFANLLKIVMKFFYPVLPRRILIFCSRVPTVHATTSCVLKDFAQLFHAMSIEGSPPFFFLVSLSTCSDFILDRLHSRGLECSWLPLVFNRLSVRNFNIKGAILHSLWPAITAKFKPTYRCSLTQNLCLISPS